MSTGCIYLLINKVNGHKYIGQTKRTLNKQWKQHIDEAMRMSPHPLHKAMRKYGNHNFMIREICECDESELDEKEEYYIKAYNTFKSAEGYNTKHNEELNSTTAAPHTELEDKTEPEEKDLWGFHKPENRETGTHGRMRILAINVDTLEETEYESFRAAALALNGDPKYCGAISTACKNNWICYGHRYKKLDDKEQSIKVYGVHYKTWEETKVFNSIRQASRIMGIRDNGIRKSIAHPYKKRSGQYFWFKAQ